MPARLLDVLIITRQFVVMLWVATGLVAVIAVQSWRHRGRFGAAVASVMTLVLVVVSLGAAVNAHYQYLPRLADVVNVPTWPTASDRVVTPLSRLQVRGAAGTGQASMTAASTSTAGSTATSTVRPARGRYPQGVVVNVDLPGPQSHFGTRQAFVYLPPQYFTEPGRRFPVVYLVHGSPGAPVDWFRAARAAQAGLAVAQHGHPVLLVAPRASRYWTDDSECVDGPHGNVQTYLAVDVPNAVDSLFRTLPGREHRGIAGNSAGGFCALNVGLHNRATFGVLLDLSGFDRPTYSGGLAKLYGPTRDLGERAAADTPAQYAAGLPSRPQAHIWLDYGRADVEARHDEQAMAVLLRARDQDVTIRERPGGHEYGVWRPALRESLQWAAPLLAG